MFTSKVVSTLNSLLRGEIAAAETYQQAQQAYASASDPAAEAELHQIHDEHIHAASELRQQVHHVGGKPDQNSGVWGAFAMLMQGTADMFGKSVALRALKGGEELGLSTYETVLRTPGLPEERLPEESDVLIRTRLLQQTESHIATLDRLLHG